MQLLHHLHRCSQFFLLNAMFNTMLHTPTQPTRFFSAILAYRSRWLVFRTENSLRMSAPVPPTELFLTAQGTHKEDSTTIARLYPSTLSLRLIANCVSPSPIPDMSQLKKNYCSRARGQVFSRAEQPVLRWYSTHHRLCRMYTIKPIT